jgi:hypothetical protein
LRVEQRREIAGAIGDRPDLSIQFGNSGEVLVDVGHRLPDGGVGALAGRLDTVGHGIEGSGKLLRGVDRGGQTNLVMGTIGGIDQARLELGEVRGQAGVIVGQTDQILDRAQESGLGRGARQRRIGAAPLAGQHRIAVAEHAEDLRAGTVPGPDARPDVEAADAIPLGHRVGDVGGDHVRRPRRDGQARQGVVERG